MLLLIALIRKLRHPCGMRWTACDEEHAACSSETGSPDGGHFDAFLWSSIEALCAREDVLVKTALQLATELIKNHNRSRTQVAVVQSERKRWLLSSWRRQWQSQGQSHDSGAETHADRVKNQCFGISARPQNDSRVVMALLMLDFSMLVFANFLKTYNDRGMITRDHSRPTTRNTRGAYLPGKRSQYWRCRGCDRSDGQLGM